MRDIISYPDIFTFRSVWTSGYEIRRDFSMPNGQRSPPLTNIAPSFPRQLLTPKKYNQFWITNTEYCMKKATKSGVTLCYTSRNVNVFSQVLFISKVPRSKVSLSTKSSIKMSDSSSVISKKNTQINPRNHLQVPTVLQSRIIPRLFQKFKSKMADTKTLYSVSAI